jgi:hypothetical protein
VDLAARFRRKVKNQKIACFWANARPICTQTQKFETSQTILLFIPNVSVIKAVIEYDIVTCAETLGNFLSPECLSAIGADL